MAISPIVIVTGAGSGIGRAASILLAAEGAKVTLVGRTQANLHETARLMRSRNPSVPAPVVVGKDISRQRECEAVVRETIAQSGRVDSVINNAGAVESQPVNDVNEPLLQNMFGVNAFGPAFLISACWPYFVRQSGGRIVNVSSMSTIDPFPGLAMYAAAKSALESYTRSVMVEGRPHHILAFTIILGAIETKMLRQIVSKELLPESAVLDPIEAASAIVDCALGRRDGDAGRPLIVRKSSSADGKT